MDLGEMEAVKYRRSGGNSICAVIFLKCGKFQERVEKEETSLAAICLVSRLSWPASQNTCGAKSRCFSPSCCRVQLMWLSSDILPWVCSPGLHGDRGWCPPTPLSPSVHALGPTTAFSPDAGTPASLLPACIPLGWVLLELLIIWAQ